MRYFNHPRCNEDEDSPTLLGLETLTGWTSLKC